MKMQLRFQLQGRSSVTKGKQGRVKETEGVLNGAVYSHCHGFFSVQKILRKKPRFFVQQEEAQVVITKKTKKGLRRLKRYSLDLVPLSVLKGSDFVAKAVDLAVRELITSASLGQVLAIVPYVIERELGMEIIEEHTVMEYSKVSKKCEKCGHGEATYYTRQMRSADKGQTTFYTCTGCGHQSQEN
ncbi:hypothetical protein JHK86_022359 [Glycine max]|nr:hypothetical protein JHK86_022359 [Glycine max]